MTRAYPPEILYERAMREIDSLDEKIAVNSKLQRRLADNHRRLCKFRAKACCNARMYEREICSGNIERGAAA